MLPPELEREPQHYQISLHLQLKQATSPSQDDCVRFLSDYVLILLELHGVDVPLERVCMALRLATNADMLSFVGKYFNAGARRLPHVGHHSSVIRPLDSHQARMRFAFSSFLSQLGSMARCPIDSSAVTLSNCLVVTERWSRNVRTCF